MTTGTTASRSGSTTGLAGTSRLVLLALRRDRLVLPAWVLGLGCFVGITTDMFARSLTTQEALVRETQLVTANAGMRMLGITSGPSVGGYMLHREFVTVSALAALMSVLAVVRHTRQNEELGRAEVLGSAVVGRRAALAAAMVVAVLADVALALAVAGGVVLAGQSLGGALLTGASVAGVGVVFVGVSAVTCQLATTTRGATGIAAAVLGVSFLLSGIGNMTGTVDSAQLRVSSAWPAWLSPIGWGQQVRPFDDAVAWPLGLSLLLSAVLAAVALDLNARRDVARGLWPERVGHARAPRSLLSPAGLAWRLQRGALIGWAVALTGFGLIFGSLSEQVRGLTGSAAEWYLETGGSDVVLDAYRTSIIAMAGMFVTVYVVQVLQRMRVDETGGTLEPLLATGVTRRGWLLGHLLNALAGAVVLLLLFTSAMAVASGVVLGDTMTHLREMTTAGMAQLPGIGLVGAAVVALTAFLPRWAGHLSWGLLLACLVLGPMFGPALGLPGWLQDLSPFTHTPKVPAADPEWVPILVLLGTALAVGVLGFLGLRRRSLVLPV